MEQRSSASACLLPSAGMIVPFALAAGTAGATEPGEARKAGEDGGRWSHRDGASPTIAHPAEARRAYSRAEDATASPAHGGRLATSVFAGLHPSGGETASGASRSASAGPLAGNPLGGGAASAALPLAPVGPLFAAPASRGLPAAMPPSLAPLAMSAPRASAPVRAEAQAPTTTAASDPGPTAVADPGPRAEPPQASAADEATRDVAPAPADTAFLTTTGTVELPTVFLTVLVDTAKEVGDFYTNEGIPARLRVTRVGGDMSQPLPISIGAVTEPNMAIGGSNPYPMPFNDFFPRYYPSTSLMQPVIAAGESSAEFELVPQGDDLVEGDEYRTVLVLPVANSYNVDPNNDRGRITFIDDDSARVEVDIEESEPGTSIGLGNGVAVDPASGNGSLDLGNGLIYSTASKTNPIFGISYYPEDGGALPGTIEAKVSVNGTLLGTSYFSTAGMSSGQGARFAMQVDTSSLATGAYSYSVEVTGHYSTTTTYTQTATGYTIIKTGSAFPIGLSSGWNFRMVNRLLVHYAGAYVTEPDGTIRGFRARSGVYTSTGGHYDSLTVNPSTGYGTVTDPYGNREVYDAEGTLVRRIDRVGNITTYTYVDANGDGKAWELRSITDPYDRITTYTYGAGGRLASSTDFANRVTTYLYDSGGNLQYVVEPDPDGPGPLTSPITTITYDSSGRLSTASTPGNHLRTIAYDFAGRIEYASYTVSTTNGRTTYLYPVQTRGLLEPGTGQGTPGNPADVVTADRIATLADPYNRLTTLHLDLKGRILRKIDPLGNTIDYNRDVVGNIWQVTRPDPDGAGPLPRPVTKYSYDGKGNLLTAIYPDSSDESWTYDPTYSQVTSHTDPLGRLTTYIVDPANGNTTAAIDPMGRITSYTYNSRGKLWSVVEPDPDGPGPLTASTTYYLYDSRGRLTTITHPESGWRFFSYNSADDLVTATDELGRVTTYTYDLISRLTGITLPDPDGTGPLTSPTVTYKLRPDGLVDSETDALGRVTTYGYDDGGRLISVTQPDPDGAGPLTAATTQYAYDLMDRLTTFTDALGRVTAYSFDEAGRLRTVTEPGTGSPRTTYTYDPLDRLAAVTDPLGRTTSYAYDAMDRLTTLTLPNAGAGSPVWSYQYDLAGQLTGQVDPLGRTTNLAYNLAGQLTRVTGPDPDGPGPLARPIVTYTYDGRGRQSAAVDPLGRVTSYAYDARNRLTTVTYPDPDGAGPQASPWTAYQYDAVGNLTALRERVDASRSRVTTFVYDKLDRLIEAKNPAYSDQAAATVGTQYAYDAMGNTTKVTDPLGRVTSYAYDGWDRLTTLTLPDPGSGSPVVKYAYDAVSNLLATTDPNGQVTSYAYDARDRLTTVTYPNPGSGSPVAKYEYDLVGNLTKGTDPLGRVTSYAYDALNRLTTVTRPDGGDGNPVTNYGYDLVGNLTKATDALGRVTSYAYDGLDRLTTLTQPSPAVGQPAPISKYEYDAAGNLTRAIDPNGNERRWAYDNLDRLVTETLPHAAGQSATAPKVVLQYDSLGRRTALTDPMSNTTTWVYDARDLVTQEIDPRNKSTSYAYDDAGQLTQKVDRNVRRVDYAYDALGRMTTETWYSGATPIRSLVQSYDKLSRLTGVADPAATLTFAYDNLSRMTTATTSGTATGQPNVTLAYGYDAVGNRTSMADNLATVGRTTYIYDALDRLGTITRAIGTATMTVAFDYDLGNRLISTARKAGASGASITSGYAYDNLDRLTTLTHQNSTTPPGTNLASYAYGYDAGGRLTKEADHRGTATYTYDPQGQLTGIDRPGTAQDKTLTFDANGNRTMSGYSTGTGNRLNSGEGYTYTYDDEGNLTSKVQTATGEVTSYTYDHRNRLTHVERRSSTNVVLAVADYVYDGLDRRIETVIDADGANPNPAVTTWTVYDGLDAYADFNASGTLQTRYLFGPGVDNLLARTSIAGATDWYLTDRLGSVREIVSGTGTVLNTADYDAFGVREATTGSGGDRWGFTGRETDAASGLQYNRARYYDPATSRWTQEDPIGFAAGDQNLYRYVGNGSANYIDPSGLYGDGPEEEWLNGRRGGRVFSRGSGSADMRATVDMTYQAVKGAERGLVTGAKANVNAFSTSVANIFTVGFAGDVNPWAVTEEDRAYGYDTAKAFGRTGFEILTGVGGGWIASTGSTAGKVVFALDMAGNAAATGRGIYNHDPLEAGFGLLGLGAGSAPFRDRIGAAAKKFLTASAVSVQNCRRNLGALVARLRFGSLEEGVKSLISKQGLENFQSKHVDAVVRGLDGNLVHVNYANPTNLGNVDFGDLVHVNSTHQVSPTGTTPKVAPRSGGEIVPTLQGNVPQANKWIRNGGRVIYHTDGSMTYIKNSVSIRYNSVGYPDFTKYLYKGGDGLSQVRIKLTDNYAKDFAAANTAAGFKNTPKGYTWHHHEDVGLMQLVKTRVHGLFWHSGGMSLNK